MHDVVRSATGPESLCLEIEPRLGEEAVLQAIELMPEAELRQFRRERDMLYDIDEGEARESAFARFHCRWLDRLHLPQRLRVLVAEQESIARSIARCLVLWATSAKEEHADLREDIRGGGELVLVLRLRPVTLVHESRLGRLLPRELLHVADLLDSAFGFDPAPQISEEGPAVENIIRQRYRVLWDTTVDGRLQARGALDGDGEELRRRVFYATFPMLGEELEAQFTRFFSGPRPSHGELRSFAADPRHSEDAAAQVSGRCPLCRLPRPRPVQRSSAPRCDGTSGDH